MTMTMLKENLCEGGSLVRLHDDRLACEGVPGACRGMVVTSARVGRDGGAYASGQYQLTKRVIAGGDLWHVRRLGKVTVTHGTETDD
jgi:hypothetical protein